jgi:hypothetical protein
MLRVFTTGAYLVPYKNEDGKFIWAVDEFEDDTFDEDGKCFNPDVISNTEKGLIKQFDDDDIQP